MASAERGGSLRTERRGWAEVRVGKAKKWQRQWAVVENLSLAIFDASSSMKPKLVIDLRFIKELGDADDAPRGASGAWVLTQKGKGKTLRMACESSQRKDWLALLTSAVSQQAVSSSLQQFRSDKLAMALMECAPPAGTTSKQRRKSVAAAGSGAASAGDRLALRREVQNRFALALFFAATLRGESVRPQLVQVARCSSTSLNQLH